MWFVIIVFWYSLNLVLYWMVLQPRILFWYLWIHHGKSAASGVVITYIIRQIVSLQEEHRYGTVFKIQGFCQTELWRQHSRLVSIIVILDRVLRATSFWKFLLIWWIMDPASLAK